MTEIHKKFAGARDSDGAWEYLDGFVWRYPVPGGWIYSHEHQIVFVPAASEGPKFYGTAMAKTTGPQ